MEIKMTGIKTIDKISNIETRQKTKVADILEDITKLKQKFVGHVARMKENRWTVSSTE